MRNIKTKQYIQTLKTKDKRKNLAHFIKQQTISFKQNVTASKEENEHDTAAPNATAVDQYQTAAIVSADTVVRRVNSYVKQKYKEYRISHQEQSLPDNPLPEISDILGNHSAHPTSNTFISKAKPYVQNKLQIPKIKEAVHTIISNPVIQKTTRTVSAVVETVRKTAAGINSLLSLGSGLILLLVMTMFVGTFSVLAQDGGSNSTIHALSPDVIAYEDTIRQYAIESDIEEYVPIIQAIMMQESGGTGTDPMNSSRSVYNTLYPSISNGIEDPEYSISCGVKEFADCLSTAAVQNRADAERLNLAIQGYNYGTEYITWALNNFSGYSKYNAQMYSDQKKTELNLSVYGDPEYVDHVMRYVSFTFRGGTDPNFDNIEAWVTKNPYAKAGLYGQCTWFAWGRFYELYGYDPGFRGNGWDCVNQLLAAHPDQFERSLSPVDGAVFSGIGANHVGIVISINDDTLTVQEGNLDGITNTFQDARKDWHTTIYTLDQLRSVYRGVVFANPIND